MEFIKLQLEVNVKNDMVIGGQRSIELYYLIIKFLDKDESFEADIKGINPIIFGCQNGFRIRSVWDEPYGAISENEIFIPRLDKVGFEFKKSFTTDMDRYIYLKKLYQALEEWANDWTGFKYDSESTMKMEENIWTVSCARRHKYREKKHYHTTKELMKKNIFF